MRKHLEPLPDYFKLLAIWKKDDPNEDQRFGQWFFNKYDIEGGSFPELFYQRDQKRCMEMIWSNYYVYSE